MHMKFIPIVSPPLLRLAQGLRREERPHRLPKNGSPIWRYTKGSLVLGILAVSETPPLQAAQGAALRTFEGGGSALGSGSRLPPRPGENEPKCPRSSNLNPGSPFLDKCISE
jgi:hypothetical protein